MTPQALLWNLLLLGLSFSIQTAGSVKVSAPPGALTPALRTAMSEHRGELLDLIESWEERAAIRQYDGGMSREDAEREAWKDVLGQYLEPVSSSALATTGPIDLQRG